MIEILTIDDALYMQKHDPDFFAEVKKEVSLLDIYTMMDTYAGKQVGHSIESYERFMSARQPETCTTCHGKGVVLPKARGVGTIHPSSANRCVLRLYNDVMGIKRPREELAPGLRTTFDFGHVAHARVQRALLAAANWDTEAQVARLDLPDWDPWVVETRALGERLAAMEFEFEDEVRVSLPEALIDGGHADGKFRRTLKVKRYDVRVGGVLEIKTAGEADYPKISKPKEDHEIQANALYANALDCPFIDYIYLGKIFDFKRVFAREFVTVFDPELFEDWCRRKLDPVEKAITTGVPPTADATSWECGGCGYGSDCKQKRGGQPSGRTTLRK